MKISFKKLVPLLAAIGGTGAAGFYAGRKIKSRASSADAITKRKIAQYFYALGQKHMYMRLLQNMRNRAK